MSFIEVQLWLTQKSRKMSIEFFIVEGTHLWART
jgi:hypothetical protein